MSEPSKPPDPFDGSLDNVDGTFDPLTMSPSWRQRQIIMRNHEILAETAGSPSKLPALPPLGEDETMMLPPAAIPEKDEMVKLPAIPLPEKDETMSGYRPADTIMADAATADTPSSPVQLSTLDSDPQPLDLLHLASQAMKLAEPKKRAIPETPGRPALLSPFTSPPPRHATTASPSPSPPEKCTGADAPVTPSATADPPVVQRLPSPPLPLEHRYRLALQASGLNPHTIREDYRITDPPPSYNTLSIPQSGVTNTYSALSPFPRSPQGPIPGRPAPPTVSESALQQAQHALQSTTLTNSSAIAITDASTNTATASTGPYGVLVPSTSTFTSTTTKPTSTSTKPLAPKPLTPSTAATLAPKPSTAPSKPLPPPTPPCILCSHPSRYGHPLTCPKSRCDACGSILRVDSAWGEYEWCQGCGAWWRNVDPTTVDPTGVGLGKAGARVEEEGEGKLKDDEEPLLDGEERVWDVWGVDEELAVMDWHKKNATSTAQMQGNLPQRPKQGSPTSASASNQNATSSGSGKGKQVRFGDTDSVAEWLGEKKREREEDAAALEAAARGVGSTVPIRRAPVRVDVDKGEEEEIV